MCTSPSEEDDKFSFTGLEGSDASSDLCGRGLGFCGVEFVLWTGGGCDCALTLRRRGGGGLVSLVREVGLVRGVLVGLVTSALLWDFFNVSGFTWGCGLLP